MGIGWPFYTAALGYPAAGDRAPMTGIAVFLLLETGLISGIRGRAAGGVLPMEKLTSHVAKHDSVAALAGCDFVWRVRHSAWQILAHSRHKQRGNHSLPLSLVLRHHRLGHGGFPINRRWSSRPGPPSLGIAAAFPARDVGGHARKCDQTKV